MKTINYISAILLLLIISCTSGNEFDLIPIPTIETNFGANIYATIDDYKTVEGIELEVDTTVDLRLMHGNPENVTDEVDGLIIWQYLSDGIGFEVNTTTDIIEKVYLYTTLYQDHPNNYLFQIQEDLADLLLGTMKISQVVDNVDNTIIPTNGIIQDATGGQANGVYFYDYEGIGRFIYISDSIDNAEGLVVQVIIGAVAEVVVEDADILYVAGTAGEQTFTVGQQAADDLGVNISTLTSATGSIVENNSFIGLAAPAITDNDVTGTFTFTLSTDSTTSINVDLTLDIGKRKGISTVGTVNVTGGATYPEMAFNFGSEGSATGTEGKLIEFGQISLTAGRNLTVTVNLTSMTHVDSTQTGIFRLENVIVTDM